MTSRNINILILAALLGHACGNRGPVTDASGTFEATEIIVSAEASGKITQLDIREGQQVEAGQVVGQVDTLQLYLRKLQLRASMRTLEGRRPETAKQLAAIQQQIVTAKKEQQRVENLLASGAANRKQLDDILAQISLLEKQLNAQKSTLDIATRSIVDESSVIAIQIAQVDDQLLKSRITSPIAGTILVKYAEAGELAAPGKPLFKIADTRGMMLRAYITSGQLTRVKTGQEINVLADFGEEETRGYRGTITWISDKAEFTPKTIQTRDERANLVYAIKVSVKNDGFLKIGMYGEIQLTIDN